MLTLDKVWAPSSWMTCFALEVKQELLTVQGILLQELGTLTPAGDILMMLDLNVWRVCAKYCDIIKGVKISYIVKQQCSNP